MCERERKKERKKERKPRAHIIIMMMRARAQLERKDTFCRRDYGEERVTINDRAPLMEWDDPSMRTQSVIFFLPNESGVSCIFFSRRNSWFGRTRTRASERARRAIQRAGAGDARRIRRVRSRGADLAQPRAMRVLRRRYVRLLKGSGVCVVQRPCVGELSLVSIGPQARIRGT